MVWLAGHNIRKFERMVKGCFHFIGLSKGLVGLELGRKVGGGET